MDFFARLDFSMEETHICFLDREGAVIYEAKTASTPEAVSDELGKALSCRRIVFETGRMAPMLYHGLSQRSLRGHHRNLVAALDRPFTPPMNSGRDVTLDSRPTARPRPQRPAPHSRPPKRP